VVVLLGHLHYSIDVLSAYFITYTITVFVYGCSLPTMSFLMLISCNL